MLIVYTSRTNNIERFIKALELKNIIKINAINPQIIDQDFWILTYTDKLGEVPDVVENFLNINYKHLKAVAASGNMNFGNNFANAANLISQKYKVPIILKFELSGSNDDREKFKNEFIKSGGF